MSITVRHGENAHWGPHVFLEGTGAAEEIRDVYARDSAGYRLGFAQMHAYGMRKSGGERVPAVGVAIRRGGADDIRLVRRLPDL